MHKQFRLRLNTFCIAALIAAQLVMFAFVAAVVLSPIRENIEFVEKELSGLTEHRALMLTFQDADTSGHKVRAIHDALRDIGNRSNLILDPELGSYYLINIAVNLLPDLLLATAPAEKDYILSQIRYSLTEVSQAGIDTQSLESLVSAPDKSLQSAELYNSTAQLLEKELRARLSKETSRLHNRIMVMAVLFAAFCALAATAVRFHLKRKMFASAEEKLRLLDKLEKANAELEHFSYFTAHDLKKPVRSIACFASLIEQSHGDITHLSVIRQSALRMEQLINDSLMYLARGKEIRREWMDMDDVVTDVREDIHSIVLESGAVFEYAGLPTINTCRSTFRRVLQNVFINAIRYRKPNTPPVIKIDAKKDKSDWVISVQDNGIGFDMEYAAQIFEPFRRLDSEATSGSGLGLSICKKLLSDLGGSIWIESEPGKGTTVFMKLAA